MQLYKKMGISNQMLSILNQINYGKKVLRVGIAGSGFAARFHFDALHHEFSTKVEIVGVYSIAKAELLEYGSSRGLKQFQNR